MKLQTWINNALQDGEVCDRYSSQLGNVMDKASLMQVVLDGNGFTFLMDMAAKGKALPYEVIATELRPFINGNYIVTHTTKEGVSYTTSAYCCYYDNEGISLTTRATMFFGCDTDVYINDYDAVIIYCDSNTTLRIHCPPTAKVVIEAWGNARCTFVTPVPSKNVKFRQH